MMKQISIYLIILIITGGIINPVQAQNAADSSRIYLKTKVGKTAVRLRWTANNPLCWKKTLQTGFIIERYTDVKDGQTLSFREKKILTPQVIKPAPLNDWEHLANNNQYAAVIAQAIYGESFEVSGMQSGNMADMINMTQNLEQRYTFAMYCADMSFEAASLAGWAFEDNDVWEGECYLYRVIPVEVDGKASIQYGFSYCCMNEYKELPAPVEVSAEFGDRTAMLYWNNGIMKNFFSAYQIERSENNKDFKALDLPVAPISDDHSGVSMYLDSLPENNKIYYYRLKGISPFGETGPPSDTISGSGEVQLKYIPQITRSVVNEAGLAEVDWAFDRRGNDLIKSFTLKRSAKSTGEYETIVSNIPKDQRTTVFDNIMPGNYLIIVAEPLQGKPTQSYPFLLIAPDSLPPLAPVGLSAKADTTGLIRINWKKNTESDLLGYRIYKANLQNEELIAISDSVFESPSFTDSVDLNNLNQHVFYAVKALDKRYNQSEFSEKIKVEKPLKVQPSSPVFTSFKVEENGVRLFWVNCPDDICARHILYRQHRDSLNKKVIRIFEGKEITEYKDSTVNERTNYSYFIAAQSKWNVESAPSPALQVVTGEVGFPQEITQFNARFSPDKNAMELSWKVKTAQPIRIFRIYRSENNAPYSLWKEIDGTMLSAYDNLTEPGRNYRYALRIIYLSGKQSEKNEITITR